MDFTCIHHYVNENNYRMAWIGRDIKAPLVPIISGFFSCQNTDQFFASGLLVLLFFCLTINILHFSANVPAFFPSRKTV